MKGTVIIIAGILGSLSIILGAFGAHWLKKRLDQAQLSSFETGVKYQMYHALLPIGMGIMFPFDQISQQMMAVGIILGTCLFSFSIYGLVLGRALGRKWSVLGPVTPVGGILLVLGWMLFVFNATESY